MARFDSKMQVHLSLEWMDGDRRRFMSVPYIQRRGTGVPLQSEAEIVAQMLDEINIPLLGVRVDDGASVIPYDEWVAATNASERV